MANFDRRVTVNITQNDQLQREFDERFRIAFEVDKTIGVEANTMQVEIYNLSKPTRQELVERGQNIQLEAGYADETELLGIANVNRVLVSHVSPNIITSLECADGIRTLSDINLSLSFKGPVSVDRILDTITDQLNIGLIDTGATIKGQYIHGFSFSGLAKEALNKVTSKANVIWTIQNGDLHLYDRFQSNFEKQVLLSPKTGMIDSPEPLQDDDASDSRARNRGYKVRSLLNPKIDVGNKLQIESEDVTGTFRIDSVTHTCDTRANDWITEAEVHAETV